MSDSETLRAVDCAKIVLAAERLVNAKTASKGRAEYWRVRYGESKHSLFTNASWTVCEFKLYEACRDSGLLGEKCLPGKNPDEK